MKQCIFCKIRDREIPKEFTFEDSEFMVFPDINPVKPIHLLIMPKRHIEDFVDFAEPALWAKMYVIIKNMIKEQKLEDKGYRLVINGGGAQIIRHFHIHLIGPMGKEAKL